MLVTKEALPGNPGLSSNTFLLMVAVLPLVFAAMLTLLIQNLVPFSSVGAVSQFASISTPASNGVVSRNYRVEGSIKKDLKPLHLFVVEDHTNGIFPKALLDNKRGPWSVDLYTGFAPDTRLRIVVVAVNDNDRDRFLQWFRRGEVTGEYTGISQVESLQELSAVNVRVSGER